MKHRHVMDPPPAAEVERADRRAEDAHYRWREFKCRECGKVWAQQVIQPTTIECPFCNEEDKDEIPK